MIGGGVGINRSASGLHGYFRGETTDRACGTFQIDRTDRMRVYFMERGIVFNDLFLNRSGLPCRIPMNTFLGGKYPVIVHGYGKHMPILRKVAFQFLAGKEITIE